MSKLSTFKEFKKKFNDWQNNPTEVVYPFGEILVQPYKERYKLSHVISRKGRMILDTKYISTFKKLTYLDGWKKSDYKIWFVIGELSYSK